MKWDEASWPFRAYLLLLVGGLSAALVLNLPTFTGGLVFVWLALTAMLALSEYAAVSFHQQGSRYALSAAEAILLPMFVLLPLSYAVWGATLANALARPHRWRIAPVQELFNVAQYGSSAFLGALVFERMSGPPETFSIDVALSAILATLTFAAGSHIFVAAAIALAGKGRFRETSLAVAPAFILNLAGNVSMGLLLAAAYVAARWTILLSAFPLGALYFGYRAVLRQNRERQRVEHLHAASRALASSPDLGDTIAGFLGAVAEIESAAEARAVLPVRGELLECAIREQQMVSNMQPVDSWVHDVFDQVKSNDGPVIVGKDEAEAARLPVQSLLAVPLTSGGEIVGCVVAVDRVGPEGFGKADARLLEALAAELALSLDSYRLFAEVAEERERFARIFAGSKEGICLIDAAGRVKAWNPALERITGYTSGDVIERVWSDVVFVRDSSEARVVGDEVIGVEPDEELELVTKSGPSRWITTLAGPVGEAEGGGWVVLVRDVTAEHEVEQAKSDFLSTISHELRTPLTSIKGSLQVLGRGLDELPTDMAEQMITVTTRGADRLERLVMNLLAVSQLESGTMAVFPDEVALGEVVRERVDAMLSEHPSTRIQLPDDPIVVRADRERLGHVLEHLLENARKFGGPEGTIVISADVHNGYARLSVSDEGPGIPAADHDRIFDRFARLGNVLTRETQGAGVGLFIAKRSVESMGGTISVDSEPGRGATFTVTLPLAKPMALSAGADSGYGA